MAQAAKPVKKKAQMPIVLLTEREILSELGPQCPPPIVDAIMASPKPKKKLREIKDAIGEIIRVCEKREGWDKAKLWEVEGGKKTILVAPGLNFTPPAVGLAKVLANEGVARLFAKHTRAFVEIAKVSGYQAFGALGEKGVGELFDSSPRAFVEIAKIAGDYAKEVFGAFGNPRLGEAFVESRVRVLRGLRRIGRLPGKVSELIFGNFGKRHITEFFAKGPEFAAETFAAIAEAAGKAAEDAIEPIVGVDAVGKLFVKHPKEFVEIARATRKAAWTVFGSIPLGFEELFDKYPGKFVEIAKKEGIGTSRVLAEVRSGKKWAELRKYCEGKMGLDEFLGTMNK
jgi:hypothetical protein